MRGNPGRAERAAEPYLPYLGHIRPDVVLLSDGSLLAMGTLHGVPHELAAEAERNAAARLLNSLWRNIADDTLTIGAHLVRHKSADQLPPAVFRNGFASELDQVYRERVLEAQLYQNTWFLSLLKTPRNLVGGSTGGRSVARTLARLRRRQVGAAPELLGELEDLWGAVARSLDAYDVRRLGLREQGPVSGLRRGEALFSEIAEALRLILTGEFLPVPLVSGPLGNAIYTDRAIFGRRAYEIRAPGGSRFGALFGFREYPATTWPGMLDAVLSLPSPLVLSQSFSFLARPDALAKLSLKANQMTAAGDKALSQIDGLVAAQDQLASGEFVMGAHHLSLAVYADSLAALDSRAGIARGELANCGAVVAQESLGMEAAYFAQLPGNLDWRTRPGAISSRNFAHLAGFDAFPRGQRQGRWGPAMLRLKTTAATWYDYIPHVDDVGMTAIFGRIGSGKTTFLLFLLAMFDQYMAQRDAGAVVFFDKDRGGELLVRAVGGRYLVVRSGEPSGLAPLSGVDNSSSSRAFLVKWLKALIALDGHGPLPPEDDGRLARAVTGIMKMPPELRSLEGLRQFLGWRDPKGAGARLERWCRGGALGWAFDGGRDEVDLDAGVVGFDLTQILGDRTIVETAAHYLLHRIRSVVDGRRFVLSCDEFRAYLINPQFAEMWEDFMLTVRKSNAIVLLVTQQPEHVLGSAFGATLVGQCFTKIFFPTPTADERVYRDELHLTAGEVRAIREDMLPGSRQFLIKRETGSVIVDFDLSAMPECVAVLSSRANTVRFAERLRRQLGTDDPAAWLPEFMSRYREAVD
jgi:type IV secretion system protein VirB4